jgi:hypothetical protein
MTMRMPSGAAEQDGSDVAGALQLLHWQKRRDAAQAPGPPRLLRLAPAFKQPPLLLVPRQVRQLNQPGPLAGARLHCCPSHWTLLLPC